MRKLLIFLIVIVALLVAIDRVSDVVAEHVIAKQIGDSQTDCDQPGVHIGGFPFLTQAISGRYSNVSFTTSCVAGTSEALRLDPVNVDLSGAHVPLSDVIHGDVQSVPVDTATGSVTLPFGDLDQAAASGANLTFSRGPNGTISVAGSLTVAGHSVQAQGTGMVTYSGGELRVAVDQVSTSAGSIDPGSAFDVVLPVPPLPFQLTGAGVTTTSAGVVISAQARNLVLSR